VCVPVLTKVLNAVLNEINGKHNCFEDSMEAFCGNRIVEENEQCDCGFERDCEERGDLCCYPHENQEKACRRKEHVMCRFACVNYTLLSLSLGCMEVAVYLSVAHSCRPCKNGCMIKMLFDGIFSYSYRFKEPFIGCILAPSDK